MRRTFPSMPGRDRLATSAELLAAGWTHSAIDHMVSTAGQEPFPRVFVGHRGQLDRATQLQAAALWAGPATALTGVAALGLHGVHLVAEPAAWRFLAPAPHWLRTAGIAIVSKTNRMPGSMRLGGVRTATAARALADAGRFAELSPGQLRALSISVLQRRLISPQQLLEELDSGRRNGTKAVREGCRIFRTGPWSMPEAWLKRLVTAHGRLPPMVSNPRLVTSDGRFVGVPDGYFPQVGVAVQVHSRTFHDGLDSNGVDLWERTVEHDSDFGAHGIVVLGVAPSTLWCAPDRFLRRLENAVAAQVGRALPAVLIDWTGQSAA